MLRAYNGEHLVSPIPLHLGLNWCTHGCRFCFANANKPDRRADPATVANAIRRHVSDSDGKSVLSMFLRRGYPILASNDSDPFAASNRDQFPSFYDALRDIGASFTFQTRGGERAAETITAHPPTLVYISFTSDDDQIIRRHEQTSPLFGERWELLQAAVAAGHHLVIGLNPFVPAWWQDVRGFLERAAGLGVRHVWHGELHLSKWQIPNLPPRWAREEAETVSYARKRDKPDAQEREALLAWCDAHSINCYENGESRLGRFWKPLDTLGLKRVQTAEDMHDALADAGGGRKVAFTFDWAERLLNPAPDHRAAELKDYMQPYARSLRNAGERIRAQSFRDVLAWHWRMDEYPTPLSSDRLSIATDGGEQVRDAAGRLVLVWSPEADDPGETEISETVAYLR